MLKLYFAPRTRSIRVRWLLEELGLPYELVRVDFAVPKTVFSQATPLGKFPVLEDGDVVMCESGAIVEYVLERHGNGRLAPAVGSPLRGRFLQWVHFAEATAYPPLGIIIWHTFYAQDADRIAPAIADARSRALGAIDFLEREIGDAPYLLGDELSGADVMMGFTLVAARLIGVLDETHPRLMRYVERLEARPAFRVAADL